jgi:ligand-binding sensor domain-containing protein
MKHRVLFSAVVLLLALFSQLFSQNNPWYQTNGPYGGNFYDAAFAANGDLYVTTWAGVYKSSNNGTSWSRCSFTTNPTIADFALDVETLPNGDVVASRSLAPYNIYRSTNGGTTWLATSGNNTSFPTWEFFNYDASNLFASSSGGGVYLSINNGASWTATNSGLTNTLTRAFTKKDSNLFVSTVGGGVFISTNKGSSWSAVNTGLTNYNVRHLFTFGSTIFAATEAGVFSTTNNGAQWTKLGTTGLTDTLTVYLLVDSNNTGGVNIYAGSGDSGIFRSTDNGATWASVNNGFPKTYVSSLKSEGNGKILATTFYGIYRSTNSGDTWNSLTGTITATIPWKMKMHPVTNEMYAATSAGLFKTINSTEWNFIDINAGYVQAYDITFTASGNLVAATGYGIYVSTDNTTTWARKLSDVTLSVHTLSNGTMIAGTFSSGKVYRSTNNGETWQASSTTLPGVAMYSISSGTNGSGGTNIYLATQGSGVYRSTDDGVTWLEKSSGLNASINALVVNNSGHIFAASEIGGVYRSTNYGDSWTAINNGLENIYAWAMAINPTNQHLFVGNGSNGVFRSTDNGNSWSAYNTNLTNTNVQSLAVDNVGYLWMGTRTSGVFRTTYSTPVAEEKNTQLNFSLSQNYPNPFNPTTTIRFEVPVSGFVSLKIFDLLGREVTTLLDEKKDVGSYEVTLDGRNLSSGVYFYRLQSGEFVQTKKLIFQK